MKTLQEQLIQKGLATTRVQLVEKTRKPKEAFTKQEIEELMGCNRPTYRRVGGAIKRKR